MSTYIHGTERQKLATAVDRLRSTYRTLAAQVEEAETRRDQAIADEQTARVGLDRLLDTRRQLQDEIDDLALQISTQAAVVAPARPNLWGERYKVGVA